MDEQGFRQFMRKFGKTESVIDGLINQVRSFETYLQENGQISLESATVQNLHDYIKTLAEREVNTRLGSLSLYYGYRKRSSLPSCR